MKTRAYSLIHPLIGKNFCFETKTRPSKHKVSANRMAKSGPFLRHHYDYILGGRSSEPVHATILPPVGGLGSRAAEKPEGMNHSTRVFLSLTSVPRSVESVTYLPVQETMTNQPTDRPTDTRVIFPVKITNNYQPEKNLRFGIRHISVAFTSRERDQEHPVSYS